MERKYISAVIPLTKAEITAKEFNKSLKNSENAYQHLVLNAIWNMFRINKHLSASRLFNLKPLETSLLVKRGKSENRS